MSTDFVAALSERNNLPVVDAGTIDAFLVPTAGEAQHCVLFFAGDPARWSETADVAVILPEVLRVFQGRLRGALVARSAEDALKARFHVAVMPSLAFTRVAVPVGVIPKVRDWSEYLSRIQEFLDPDAAPLSSGAKPQMDFVVNGKRVQA